MPLLRLGSMTSLADAVPANLNLLLALRNPLLGNLDGGCARHHPPPELPLNSFFNEHIPYCSRPSVRPSRPRSPLLLYSSEDVRLSVLKLTSCISSNPYSRDRQVATASLVRTKQSDTRAEKKDRYKKAPKRAEKSIFIYQ